MKDACEQKYDGQSANNRDHHLEKANKLALFTIIWNSFESVLAIILGLSANSVSLMAYGLDGILETLSAVIMLWRIRAEKKAGSTDGAEKHESIACRLIGILLLILAIYICIDSGTTFVGLQDKPEPSWPGAILTGIGLIVTPLLARRKLKCSHKLHSGAQRADAMQSLASCWLGLTATLGLLATAALGWSWADPLAGLLFVPIIVKEGVEAVRCK